MKVTIRKGENYAGVMGLWGYGYGYYSPQLTSPHYHGVAKTKVAGL